MKTKATAKSWIMGSMISMIFLLCTLCSVSAAIIQVQNPGNNNDIQPAIMKALTSALDGDMISIPAGTFVLNKNVTVSKFISFKGAGIGKTILYRAESVTDATFSNSAWDGMLKFNINKSKSSNITVTDITFKSKKPSITNGDGGSRASDIGIKMINCIDFVIARCRFEYFGNGAVSVTHTDTMASGLIYKNEFYHNLKGADGLGLGYGVVIYGASKQWIKNPKLGSGNFIFIEDNTFDTHRHAIAAGGSALYVARYNKFNNNLMQHCIDTHSAQGTNDANHYGSRAVEIYNNNLTNTRFKDGTPIVSGLQASRLNETGILMRAGDAIVFNNTVVGYRFAVGISVYPDPGSVPYPLMSQPGYLSGLNLGPNHTGTDSIKSDGDLFAYNNTFTPWVSSQSSSVFYNYNSSLYKQNRDYHLVAKPGYKSYIYPHPLTKRVNISTTINTINTAEINMYPNPATDLLNIQLPDNERQEYKMEIFDLLGRTTLSRNLSISANENIFQLAISDLKPGTYLLRMSTAKDVYMKKFIKIFTYGSMD
jgi:hypothetical protein